MPASSLESEAKEMTVVGEYSPSQFTFASLFKAGPVAPPIAGHWPIITPELEKLYPELQSFNPGFDYS
jgi:hypothetical protein